MLRRKTIDRPPPKAATLRDPEALARLFDAHAQMLLRLAIHLVGDAAQAEDLVQETFLAVLEAADRYDATRPVEPWLRGILMNCARRHRRQAARKVDPKAAFQRAASAPIEDVIGADEAGAVAEAIDRLDEPNRQVVLLRVRHGMSAADIAHVLERSPGTVRVQLHRGIAALRRVLPVAVALLGLSGLSGLAEARGLAAVREAVVAHARSEAALKVAGATTGGVIVGKNLIVWGAAVAALLALWQPWRVGNDVNSDDLGSSASTLQAQADGAAEPEAKPTLRPPRAREPDAEDAPVEAPGHAFDGKVVHATTKAPLAGVSIAYFGTEEATLTDLKRTAWARVEQLPRGSVRSLTDSPVTLEAPSAGQRMGQLPVEVFADPGADAAPLAAATTAADGTFRISTPAVPGVLRVSQTGFGTRRLPAQGSAQDVTVELQPIRTLRGRVLDVNGEPFRERLHILLSGGSSNQVLAPNEGRQVHLPTSAVVTQTDAAGRFEAYVGSEWLSHRCRTPGYRLEHRDPSDWRRPIRSSLQARPEGEEGPPVTLVALPVAALVIRDAVTKEPIEDFFLHGRDRSHGLLNWSGRFHAPGGRFTLLEWDTQRQRAQGQPITLHVWAEGYRPARVASKDLTQERWLQAELVPGEAPGLGGTVHRHGMGAAGVEVALLTYRRIAWSERDTDYVAWTRTDTPGRFELYVPKGYYVLRVGAGEDAYQRVVQVGRDDDLSIDLDSPTAIEVRVMDTAGKICADHAVGINGDDGRSTRLYTGSEGIALFRLPPGSYKMFVPQVSTKGSFVADELQEVVLVEGERKQITFTVPDSTAQVYVRLTCDSQVEFTTWRARQIDPHQGELVALWSDGTIPLAVQAGVKQIDVELPDGRRFDLVIPKSPTKTVERHVRLNGPRYEGVLLTESGSPRAGVRIIARQRGEGLKDVPKPSCVTDANGRFILHCESAAKHTLGFNKDPERASWNHLAGGFDGLWYVPNEPASDEPTPIELRLRSTRRGDSATGVKVFGIVRSEDPERPLRKLGMSIGLLFPDDHGQMRVSPDGCFFSPDESGRYEIFVQRAPQYRIHVYDRRTGKPITKHVWMSEPETRETEQNFVVPKAP